MLQLANVVLLEGERIAKARRWILDGIALRQPSPGRGCEVEQRNADQGDQTGLETLMGQGGTPVLTRLWHSRMIAGTVPLE